jgi:hypothetical protein
MGRVARGLDRARALKIIRAVKLTNSLCRRTGDGDDAIACVEIWAWGIFGVVIVRLLGFTESAIEPAGSGFPMMDLQKNL